MNDADSATFGRFCSPNTKAWNLRKVLEGSFKSTKCQVAKDCDELAVGFCTEKAYRGCTLAFCETHSGQVNRERNEWLLCKLCAKDLHSDICQECSRDIMDAR